MVVKRYRDCIAGRYVTYQATSTEPLSSTFDGGVSSYGAAETIRVFNVVAGRHVEMELQHIGTRVVLRKYGRHFSVAVRTPTKIATAFSGALDVQLCTTRCPAAERLSLRHVTLSSVSMTVDRAAEICRQQQLIDFFLDACVFDLLVTGGDRNFTLAAVHALRDYRRLSRDAAMQLQNRTEVRHISPTRNSAPAHNDVTVLLYLTILLLSPFAVTTRILCWKMFFYAA